MIQSKSAKSCLICLRNQNSETVSKTQTTTGHCEIQASIPQ